MKSNLAGLIIVTEDDNSYKPGFLRCCKLKNLGKEATRLYSLGIEECKIFVKTPRELKDANGSIGLKSASLMVRAIKAIKKAEPSLRIGTEVCACAYQSEGECVIFRDQEIDDESTHNYVGRMAVLHANAGADFLIAGLTHRGSVKAMRKALDNAGYEDRDIMGSIQLRSKFYSSYRKLMGTEPLGGETYRSHLNPSNKIQVIEKAKELIAEGATSLSIQPAITGAHMINEIAKATLVPIYAYVVSGELNLVKGELRDQWISLAQKDIFNEYAQMLIDAGASKILTYISGDLSEEKYSQYLEK